MESPSVLLPGLQTPEPAVFTAQNPRAAALSPAARADYRLPDPAEIEKLKAEWRREFKHAEAEHNTRRAELIRIRAQLHAAQQRVDEEMKGRRIDASKAAASIASLTRQLGEAKAALSAKENIEVRHRKVRTCLSTAAALAATAAIWGWTRTAAPVAPTKASVTEAVSRPPVTKPAPGSAQSSGHQGFSHSLARLDEALSSFPGRDPEEVLSLIRSSGDRSACSLQWNAGQPALMYSGGTMGSSLSDTLDHCAQAVERYRQTAVH